MKHILTILTIMLLSVGMVSAQTDSSKRKKKQAATTSTHQSSTQKKQTTESKSKKNNGSQRSSSSSNSSRRSSSSSNSSSNAHTIRTSSYTPNVNTYYANGVSFQMVEVRGGTFRMGGTSEQGADAESYEKPAHNVTLSSYYIGKYEVTQELWQSVMGESITDITKRNGWSTYGVGARYPMYDISWNDCKTFISKLNSITGKNFRMPTEAEWEFASRGGTKSQGYKYSGSNTLNNVAWYTDNSGSTTHEVGQKSPNELGIYDMSGNVWEWCSDWYGNYSSGTQSNPTGAYSGSYRVYRGGSWHRSARGCRSSYRGSLTPGGCNCYLGLRLALSE